MKGKFKALAVYLAVAFVFCLASPSFATVTLPSTGVDVSEYIDAAILAVGVVAASAIGGFCAYTILKRGIRWIRTALT
jgi:hypothetical protein